MIKSIAENLQIVGERIRTAEKLYNRLLYSVNLVAVSKMQPAAAIEAAYQIGIRNLGENYLQEALEKMQQLKHLPLIWHFIGTIQSNKTRAIAENFDWVHTIDNLKHAKRLNDQRPETREPLNVCIEINISQEASKSGILAIDALGLLQEISQLPKLRVRGLMTIPEPSMDFGQQRLIFAKMAQLFHELKKTFPTLDTLSMGMSQDLEAAIAEGATLVRIGTAIFGERTPH